MIERFLDALNRADAETAVSCLHEDVVHDRGGGAREIGRRAFREFLVRRRAETGEEIGDIVVMANDDGTRAAAEFSRRGRSRSATGMVDAGPYYSISGGIFFEIEDGSILRITPAEAFAHR